MRQTLDRESRTVLGRLRIWRTERSLRELVGVVRGRDDLVESWREDLDGFHKSERAALCKEQADNARRIEQKVREAYRKGAAGRRAERTGDRAGPRRQGHQAGAQPEHNPHSPTAPLARPRAWRGRARAVTLDVGITSDAGIHSNRSSATRSPATSRGGRSRRCP